MSKNWNMVLSGIYGDFISCTENNADADVKKKKDANAEIAIYCNTKYQIAVVWDVAHHKACESKTKYLTYSKEWSRIVVPEVGMDYNYKSFKTIYGNEYEKILIVTYETLDKIKYDLYDYLKFDINDEGMSLDVKSKIDKLSYRWVDDKSRKRTSTSIWIRSQIFRQLVLDNYDYTCAICGCSEEKILEAAHIIAVKDSGKDTVENGICLCRNHHRMFDEGLIKLNFKNHKIYDIKPSVKEYVNDTKNFRKGKHEG